MRLASCILLLIRLARINGEGRLYKPSVLPRPGGGFSKHDFCIVLLLPCDRARSLDKLEPFACCSSRILSATSILSAAIS